MTETKREITTNSAEETERLAERIARKLRGGEVIELASDLGGGKTTFTRGLAAGLGSTDAVASPTFTLSREYAGGRLCIYHFDFYRLSEAGIMNDELTELIGDPEGVVVVEWAELVRDVLPEVRLQVQFTAIGEAERTITVEMPETLSYLGENI